METSRAGFIDFMCASGVLLFGDFTTKSGRKTPYFIDTGRYTTGSQMRTLGRAYASTIAERFGDGYDVLFGPAYKGIPLVVATASALAEIHGRDVPILFDRKEAKDHGEGGSLVGHRLQDGERVLIVEDVTTAGTSIRHSVPLLRAAANVEVVGLVVSVDRMERGPHGDTSALEAVGEEFGLRAEPIVTLDDILAHLAPGGGAPSELGPDDVARIEAYRKRYGAVRTAPGSD
ncbi:MAG: orotate phosphoribosyltransferase [Planctomycetota bacterium]